MYIIKINKEDLKILQSEIGRQKIADLHINAIKRICGV